MYYFACLTFLPFILGQLMPGGQMEQSNLEDDNLLRMASFVARNYSAERNLQLSVGDNVELIGARTQVVAGVNYFLKLRLTIGDSVEICKVTVWDQPWLPRREITSSECNPIVGGYHSAANDELAKEAASFAADQLNGMSNDYYFYCLTEVRHPRKQVVAGLKFVMDLVMSQSTAKKQGPFISAAQNCPLSSNPNAKHSIYAVEVLFQNWMKPKFTLLKYKHNDNSIDKKMLPVVDLLNAEKKSEQKSKRNILGGDGHDFCHGGMFAEFKQRYSKVYSSPEEETKRFAIFCDNMKKVKDLQDNERGSARYGATIFADLTTEEFKKYRGNGKLWDLSAKNKMKQAKIPKVKSIPKNFDWRTHNVVTPVKNQGSCGSCWAFSVTGDIEGQWALKKKSLISLSEQELVDCDKKDQGCDGGEPMYAYEEIIRLGGLETETEYKYKGRDESCHFKKSEVKVYINSSVAISSNETEMAIWLYKNGPISIGINANAMQFYFGGISHPWKIFCNPESLDHGVLIVGYGVRGTEPYWIIKNSWGESWGEKGYYLVYRGDGVCGLNRSCSSAIVD